MRYCVAYKCREVAHFFVICTCGISMGGSIFYGNEAAVKGAAMVS